MMLKKQDTEVVQSFSGSNPGSPLDQHVTLINGSWPEWCLEDASPGYSWLWKMDRDCRQEMQAEAGESKREDSALESPERKATLPEPSF